MKQLVIKYSHNGNEYTRTAFINDDINTAARILADDPRNAGISAECGMADELGIWHVYFKGAEFDTEADFIALPTEDGETLTLDPCEVLLWGENGRPVGAGLIPFTCEVIEATETTTSPKAAPVIAAALFLLSLTIGNSTPAQIYTDSPADVLAQVAEAGETVTAYTIAEA